MSKKSARDPLASTLDTVKQTSFKMLADAGDFAAAAAPKLREAAEKARPQVEAFAEKARPQVEALTEKARPQVEALAEKARPRVEALTEKARPQVEAWAEKARPQVEAFAEKARPQVEAWAEKANSQVQSLAQRIEENTPEARQKAGTLANTAASSLASIETPQLIDDLAARLTGDKKAMKKARKALVEAGKKVQKETAKKSSGGKKALVWTLVAGSVAGIGYFVWKKAQPVEDPWSTPLPNNRPADARPVGSTPAARQSTPPEVSEVEVPAGKEEAVAAEDPTAAEEDSAAKH